MSGRLAGVVLWLASAGAALGETAGDAEYGAYLAGECVGCHQRDGGANGIPSIVHWPAADFVAAMQAYKTKARDHPVMQMVAGRLGEAEIAALAAYFETID